MNLKFKQVPNFWTGISNESSAKVCEVILAAGPTGLTMSEIAFEAGYKNTFYELCKKLERLGFITIDKSKRPKRFTVTEKGIKIAIKNKGDC